MEAAKHVSVVSWRFFCCVRCSCSTAKRKFSVSAPSSLKEVYCDEIKDLWSANDQMVKALTTLNEGVHHKKLKTHFSDALKGISKHNETLKGLLGHQLIN
jgi:hypothetical protein